MAGGNDNAGSTMELQYGIGKLRNAVQRVIEINLNAVCRQNERRLFGKYIAHPSGIIGDSDAAARFANGIQIVRKGPVWRA